MMREVPTTIRMSNKPRAGQPLAKFENRRRTGNPKQRYQASHLHKSPLRVNLRLFRGFRVR
jgi:hypothetical protein